jgi:hypothetical protein
MDGGEEVEVKSEHEWTTPPIFQQIKKKRPSVLVHIYRQRCGTVEPKKQQYI